MDSLEDKALPGLVWDVKLMPVPSHAVARFVRNHDFTFTNFSPMGFFKRSPTVETNATAKTAAIFVQGSEATSFHDCFLMV